MSILIDGNVKAIVQGVTGNQGSFHTKLMLEYGTKIVAGVTPGKGGQEIHGIPVFNSIADALGEHDAEWSIIYVPAKFVKSAAFEALDNMLNIVIISEGVPVHDSIAIMKKSKEKGLVVVGPNCPGIISPGKSKLGIMPEHIFVQGNVGLVSRSGTLTYEIINELTRNGLGQSTAVGIGGDPVVGLDFISALKLFEEDPETKAIVLIGEIGGDMEENTAKYIKENISKPVVAYIAGKTAPKGKKMGHAGAVISGDSGTAETKVKALAKVGIKVAELPSQIPKMLKEQFDF